MTTGALIFAQNNEKIDYVKLAGFCASRIKEHLDIPVSVVTDSPDWLHESQPADLFDKVITIDGEHSQNKRFYDSSMSSNILRWKNFSRFEAYQLTPYDNTLLLDSDFIINSPLLKKAFDREYDFQLYRNSFELSGWRSNSEFERINQFSIPFYWATVAFFRKSQVVESFFDLVSYIKDNWLYFRMLYNIDSELYRNDFSFSIAAHIMNGKTNGEFVADLPGKMTYTLDRDILLECADNKMKFLVEKRDHLGEYIAVKTCNMDVHVMNKSSLIRFINGGSGV